MQLICKGHFWECPMTSSCTRIWNPVFTETMANVSTMWQLLFNVACFPGSTSSFNWMRLFFCALVFLNVTLNNVRNALAFIHLLPPCFTRYIEKWWWCKSFNSLTFPVPLSLSVNRGTCDETLIWTWKCLGLLIINGTCASLQFPYSMLPLDAAFIVLYCARRGPNT